MSARRHLTLTAVFLLLIGLGVTVGAGNASANPPPPGYPTASQIAYANDTIGRGVFLRRGYWDPAANGGVGDGWGWDTIWGKHALNSTTPVMAAIRSDKSALAVGPSSWPQATYRVNANKVSCGLFGCSVLQVVVVRVGVDFRGYTTYKGWPAGGPSIGIGVITAYCEGYNPECPWVSTAVNLTGASMQQESSAPFTAIYFSPVTGESQAQQAPTRQQVIDQLRQYAGAVRAPGR